MNDHAGAYWIRGGKLADAEGGFAVRDLRIEHGRIAQVLSSSEPPSSGDLDASGLFVAPGFIDIHVHLREPGQSFKETIATGTAAAAAGGFTSVCCMPNTQPVNDSPAITRWMQSPDRGARVNVFPIAAATAGSLGGALTDYPALRDCRRRRGHRRWQAHPRRRDHARCAARRQRCRAARHPACRRCASDPGRSHERRRDRAAARSSRLARGSGDAPRRTRYPPLRGNRRTSACRPSFDRRGAFRGAPRKSQRSARHLRSHSAPPAARGRMHRRARLRHQSEDESAACVPRTIAKP